MATASAMAMVGEESSSMERQGLANGDLDLVVIPRHELAAATDDFGVHDERLDGGVGKGVRAALPALREGAGDVVGVVGDERPLDAVVDVLCVQRGRAAVPFGELGCALVDLLRDRLGDLCTSCWLTSLKMSPSCFCRAKRSVKALPTVSAISFNRSPRSAPPMFTLMEAGVEASRAVTAKGAPLERRSLSFGVWVTSSSGCPLAAAW